MIASALLASVSSIVMGPLSDPIDLIPAHANKIYGKYPLGFLIDIESEPAPPGTEIVNHDARAREISGVANMRRNEHPVLNHVSGSLIIIPHQLIKWSDMNE